MKILNQEQRKQALHEEIVRMQEELNSLYKERDLVLEEIRDQRQWSNLVYSKKTYYDKCVDWLLRIYDATVELVNKKNVDFYNLTDKQANKITELNEKISTKVKELSEYDKKELINIDAVNKKYKKDYTKKQKELSTLERSIEDRKQEIKEFEEYKNKESNKLERQRNKQEDTKKALMKLKKTLELKEKRLDKYALELKNKKNVKNMN